MTNSSLPIWQLHGQIVDTLRNIASEEAIMEEETADERGADDNAREPYKARLKALKAHLEELMQQSPAQGVIEFKQVAK